MKKIIILIISSSIYVGCNNRDTKSASSTDTFAHNDSSSKMEDGGMNVRGTNAGDTGNLNGTGSRGGNVEGMQGGTGNGSEGGVTGGNGSQAGTRSSAATSVDAATSTFLNKAAGGGMAEVEAGKMGQQMGSSAAVKSFAAMMVQDHTGANAGVTRLASERSVTLPTTVPADKKQKAQEMMKKKGKDFDVAYMNMMVEEHKSTIQFFEKAQRDTKDEKVKSFITTTLPKLKMHLDSAQAITARVKKNK